MKTRVAVHLLEDTAEQRAPAAGVAAIASGPGAGALAATLLGRGANEVLVLPAAAALPRHICIHWMGDGVRHATLAVAASLLRHLPAEAICYAVAPEARRDQRPAALRALLDARSEAKAAHGLEVRTELLSGTGPAALLAQLTKLEAPMLVLGVTRIEDISGPFASLVNGAAAVPVLVVYRGAA
jgi:hypothetical protein